MIYSAWYYPGSFQKNDLIVRDNRFYPGKYLETFPVWLEYIEKNFPNEHIILFNDVKSPCLLTDNLGYFKNYEFIQGYKIDKNYKIHIKNLDKFSNKYFWAMQRNLCEGLIFAYKNFDNFLWIDNDFFLNSDIYPFIKNNDVFAPLINHTQFTCDSVCTYFSSKRLHELDNNFYLPDYLTNILENAAPDTRAHTFQEGGLYKLFCYGKMASSTNINASHLSNYNNFMKFLYLNPLDSQNYRDLVKSLETFDFNRI
jgi:hypothetical protein